MDESRVPSASPTTRPPGVPIGLPGAGGASLVAYLAPVGQGPFTVNMGDVPVSARGPVTLNHDVACASGCRLVGFSLAPPLGFKGVLRGTFTLSAVTMDGSAPAPLGGATAWVSSGQPDAPAEQLRPYARATDAGDPTYLGLAVQTTALQSGSSSRSIPAASLSSRTDRTATSGFSPTKSVCDVPSDTSS